ncbi:MAG: hypothetical protein HYZ75_09460 [Elusimicrobia bacterium]|nr:hypothetical protein [Elusimicrobiota bacterium]
MKRILLLATVLLFGSPTTWAGCDPTTGICTRDDLGAGLDTSPAYGELSRMPRGDGRGSPTSRRYAGRFNAETGSTIPGAPREDAPAVPCPSGTCPGSGGSPCNGGNCPLQAGASSASASASSPCSGGKCKMAAGAAGGCKGKSCAMRAGGKEGGESLGFIARIARALGLG